MNRRNFIGKILAAGAMFTILPPSSAGRIWKATKPEIIVQPSSCLEACGYIQILIDEAPVFERSIWEELRVGNFE
jgi:hypothetical protein